MPLEGGGQKQVSWKGVEHFYDAAYTVNNNWQTADFVYQIIYTNQLNLKPPTFITLLVQGRTAG